MDRIGKVAVSLQGRDAGRSFIIIDEVVDEKVAYVVDGRLRKVTNPKKKKFMHLKIVSSIEDEEALEKIKSKNVTDSFIRKLLSDVAESQN